MRVTVPFLLIALLLTSLAPLSVATSGRAVNIDLDVGAISITYPDSTNESKYQMFSSNHPIANFNRPADLYVVDGVKGVEMNIDVTVNNLGSVQSGFVDFNIVILHNEYARFELHNSTTTMQPISGGTSSSIDILFTPYYSGNHTMQISVSNPNGDDDTSNNQASRHLTVAYHYDNCNDVTTWTATGEWGTSSDTYISQFSSFHVGNGQFSTYSNNGVYELTSPVFDMADSMSGHNDAIGYSFFYTGGAAAGDSLKGYVKDANGQWAETFDLQNVVDNNFQDGVSWQTFSVGYNGKNSPLIPIGSNYFHSQSQIKFRFSSDAVGGDIGYWIDDFVIVYDQAAQKREYNVDLSGVSIFGGLPGDWSTTRLKATNTGNISASFTPTATGVPNGYVHYFAYTNGASIGSNGMELLPGESREFDFKVLVDENASQGNLPVTVNLTSNRFADIDSGVNTQIKILPDRIPNVIIPEVTPRCLPGDTCSFSVTVENIGEATDVFSISTLDKNMPSGWDIDIALNQSTNVLVRVDTPQQIWMTATIPSGVEADTIAEVWLTATSTNDSRRFDTKAISVAAAMISDAEIVVESMNEGMETIDAGESTDITFRIYNNASRMDIFRPEVEFTQLTGWSVELLFTPDIAINSGSSSTFKIRVTAPDTAQANDIGPAITAKALSVQSGSTIVADEWQNIRVNTVHDLSIRIIESPQTLSPGVANLVTIEVTNDGNGPATAMLDLPWSPDSWEWWALHEGVNVTDGVPLSVSYDLNNVKVVNFWIMLSPLEAPGEFHEIVIHVSPENGEDSMEDDNSAMFESITETVRQPRLDGYGEEVVVSTGSTYSLNATAWNIGNAADSTIKARLLIQTSPPSSEVIGFLSTSNGKSEISGEWLNLNLGPTQSVILTADVVISEDCDLNTLISVKIELEGGSDDLGRPIMKSVASALMVGERRNVDFELPEEPDEELVEGSNHLIWINLSSTSTQGEIFTVSSEIPTGWGVLCDGTPLHIEDIRIEMEAGHVTTQRHNMRCEVVRESGTYAGDLIIHVNGSDGEIQQEIRNSLSWEEPEVESGIQTSTIIIGIVSLLVILVVVMLFLRRGKNYIDDEEVFEKVVETPMVGPPATAFAGPPATVMEDHTQVSEVDPAVLEYQRQMEDYNRKMAEYEAWQAAQSSQPESGSQ